jgi:acetyltransferase-like isoleucine patch superfamily enzyme
MTDSGPAERYWDYCPGEFWLRATPGERAAQERWQAGLADRGGISLGQEVFVSELAALYPDRFSIGDDSYVGAQAYVTGDVIFGGNCTLNPFATVRGLVRAGDGVRVGAHSAILGFNHTMSPDAPVFRQPLRFDGITIGDDVWIGSNVTIIDGVTIGSHAVIGGGAVVTRDVADWSIVAGNPARPIGDRRTRGARRTPGLDGKLAELGRRARDQAGDLLQRAWQDGPGGLDGPGGPGALGAPGGPGAPDGGTFRNTPGAAPTRRAWCDAVELADLLTGSPVPPGLTRERLLEVLAGAQDAVTGLVPEIAGPDDPADTAPLALPVFGHAPENYHILCAGYALQLLGARFPHPITAVSELSANALVARLDGLPWPEDVWACGSAIDSIGTAMYLDRAGHGRPGQPETVLGWMLSRCHRESGMWGRPDDQARWQLVVNGFYRATRGTFAQFGVPLPYPERAVDTLLTHMADSAYFRDDCGTACNVLDVIHPLWLCAKQTSHRRQEAENWVRWQLGRAVAAWSDGAGFSFELEAGHGDPRTPSLLGTEMWLATIWLLADYLGVSEALGYRPRGVHRPEPALSLPVPG